MMQVSDSLQNILNDGNSTEKKTTSKKGSTEMDMMSFLNLFIAQLKNQDPLQPMDNNQLTSQTSQFSMVEQLTKISTAVNKLVSGSSSSGLDSLYSASSFIGKMVEFNGDSMIFDGKTGYFDFNLESASNTTEVYIYDSAGSLVNAVDAGKLSSGKNSIVWDGTDSNGKTVGAGRYKFVVKAYDSTGKEIPTTTYGNGYVSGVSQKDGKIVFDLFGESLDAEKILSVRSY